MAKTAELDTKKEAPPDLNGHGESDEEFLQHITSKEPAEELLDVPEWDKQVLCKALYPGSRIQSRDRTHELCAICPFSRIIWQLQSNIRQQSVFGCTQRNVARSATRRGRCAFGVRHFAAFSHGGGGQ
jgi:hypothetical protein